MSEPQRLRFLREGQLTAALNHPNLVRVHASGEVAGMPYLVYELVPGGRTLKDCLFTGDREERLRLLRDTARGLGHAHAHGVIHRDVKPANVLVDPSGHVRVADFGLALSDEVERLTLTAAVMGTPAYMAPEQTERDRNGPWTDVWALGIMLFAVLTGQRPFPADSGTELRLRTRNEDVPAPADVAPGVPSELSEICLKALARDPAQRYPDASALAADLDCYLSGTPSSVAPPKRSHAKAIGLAVLLAVGALSVLAGRAWLTRSAPPVASQPPLVLTFEEPLEPIRSQQVRLRASLDPPKAKLSLEGPGKVRRGARGRVTLDLPLQPGLNEWVLVLEDGDRKARQPLRIEGLTPWPAWYLRLDEAKRPPARDFLTPAKEIRTYRWSRDGSLFAVSIRSKEERANRQDMSDVGFRVVLD